MPKKEKEKKPKWYTGKSPEERRWKALRIIYDELLPNNKPIRAADLKAEARGRPSASTLTDRLRELEHRGWVKRIVYSDASPPSVFYVKNPLPTVVFFETSGENGSSTKYVDSFKLTSLSQLPYFKLKPAFPSEAKPPFESRLPVHPSRKPFLDIPSRWTHEISSTIKTLYDEVRVELCLPEDEPLIFCHISQREKFPK